MAKERVFIAYDFEIKGGLLSDFEYVDRKQPQLIEWPGRPEGRSQGEIWRNIVRPKLDSFPRFVAFVDLPNANVGFEIGYALGHGEGKEAALAHTRDELPRWLRLPPLDGFYCQQIVTGEDLLSLVVSDQWFKSPPRPKSGDKVLILCPPKAGHNFMDFIKENHPSWLSLPADGWSFNDLPEKLNDVGLVVW